MGLDSLLSPKEQLIEDLRQKIQSIQARINENRSIIEQNQLEVDRLQQRSVSISAQIKRIEDNFDTVPRQDIRVAYEGALDARGRLVAMRSQMEKLQDVQTYLQEYQDSLQQTLDALEGVTMEGRAMVTGGFALSGAGEQIVKMILTQENDKKDLAVALHDGPATSLTNLTMQANFCKLLFDRNPDEAAVELEKLKKMSDSTFQSLRNFIFELRPMMLTDLGLVATVKRYVDNLGQKNPSLQFQFHLTGPADRRFSEYVEVLMYRGVQSLLLHALNPLKATKISVRLDIGDSKLLGVVENNGKEIDWEAELAPDNKESPFHALGDFRQVLQMVEGKLEAFYTAGQGNIFEIHLPFAPE